MRTTVLVASLTACGWHPGPACHGDGYDDCVDQALRTPEGDPDGCDLAACVSCAAACGGGCAVQESWPPRYACDGATWDVYDACPDWGASATVRAEDVVDLGCGNPGAEALTAAATGPGRVAVVHVDYAVGCCPEAVEVDVVATGSTLAVGYALVRDACECACGLDVSYDLVDVPTGTWTIVAGASGATAEVVVP